MSGSGREDPIGNRGSLYLAAAIPGLRIILKVKYKVRNVQNRSKIFKTASKCFKESKNLQKLEIIGSSVDQGDRGVPAAICGAATQGLAQNVTGTLYSVEKTSPMFTKVPPL